MNPLPDSIERRVLRRSFLWLSLFFIFLYLWALVVQELSTASLYQKGGLVFGLRIFGLTIAVTTGVLATRGPQESPWLYPLALWSSVVHWVISLTILLSSGGELILSQMAFLVISALYLFLIGVYSSRSWNILAAGAGLTAVSWVVFIGYPQAFFTWQPGAEPQSRSMNVILSFGLAVVTFSVWMNHRMGLVVVQASRDSADRLARLAFFDIETGLPNGLRLEKDLAGSLTDGIPPGTKIVLAGFHLEGLETLNESRGFEFTSQLVHSVARDFATGLGELMARYPEIRAPGPLAPLYRVESSSFAIPLVLPAGFSADTGPLRNLVEGILADRNRILPLGHPLRFYGGFTVWPDDSPTTRQLTRNLLNLLHEARVLGHGDFIPFNPESYRGYVRREAIKEALAGAIAGGEMTVVFQPRVRVAGGVIEGYEALVRWTSPALGTISPAEFVPLAERQGLIEALTWKALDRSCDLIRLLRTQGRTEFRISINLSPGLLTPRFLEALHGHCQVSGLAPFLELEITEGILMVLDPGVTRLFGRLRDQGMAFAIDDFGTGYSNLGYLQSFEAEVLKIDKQFIDGIPADEKSGKLVRAILQMAHSFGMKVVAEGVERRDQRDYLVSMGCDQVQGYFYSPPLGSDEVLLFTVPGT